MWYVRACEQLADIKQKVGDNFQTLVAYIDKVYFANYNGLCMNSAITNK